MAQMAHIVPNDIARLRKQKNLSQAIFAGKLNMSVAQLSRLERGISSMTQARMIQIAEVLGVEPKELYLQRMSREHVELEIVHAVVFQIDEMVDRLGITLSPKQRADLTVELYRQEASRLEETEDQTVDVKRYENIVLAVSG